MLSLSLLEQAYFPGTPADVHRARVVVVGSGLGLCIANQIVEAVERGGKKIAPGEVVVLEGGPFDVQTHLANTGLPRIPLMQLGLGRLGGKTTAWGTATPRPPQSALAKWPCPFTDLERRFDFFEKDMGVQIASPLSDRKLDRLLAARLGDAFANHPAVTGIIKAPLAIDAQGHRWSSLDVLPKLLDSNVRILPHARVTKLTVSGGGVQRVCGTWFEQPFALTPEIVVLAVGVEGAFWLLLPVLPPGIPFQPADHIRLDMHGLLAPDFFGDDFDELGVAVQNVNCRARTGDIHWHAEVKVAPRPLWRKYMPSGDNLRSNDPCILVQIQAIAQMHGRLSTSTLVRDPRPIHAQVDLRDIRFHREIAELLDDIGTAIGLKEKKFCLRPLLENHHLHGLLRVGLGLRPDLSIEGMDNCFVAAPTAYVDWDDDANPVLPSRVLNSYLAARVADKCWDCQGKFF